MPRNFKLTWQPGINGRAGRWSKKYKRKRYYFPGGSGKFDREAYEAALVAWEDKKREIDAAAPKPHQVEYEQEIDKWELALAWCRKHVGEEEMAELAMAKLTLLRKRFSAPKPRPIGREDTLDGQFGSVTYFIPENVLTPGDLIGLPEKPPESNSTLPDGDSTAATTFEPVHQECEQDETNRGLTFRVTDEFEGWEPDRLQTERKIWRDRIEVLQRSAAPLEQTVQANLARFLEVKKANVAAGELSEGRPYMLQLHLSHFADWVGHDTAVTEINAQALSDYRLELLKQVEAKKWSSTTAKERMGNVKSFVLWLFEIEAIPAIPRVMVGKSKALQISPAHTTITVFTTDEVTQSLAAATDRTKLYILLMLNCGMTQKDIADLLKTEVDWNDGRVTRRRSKTRKHKNVPIVSYKLWPETLRLLRQEQASNKKTDNIGDAFHRLNQKTKINKPLKSLKKTSATLIRGNEKYASLESLYLGHAPQSMADKHYAAAPQELLDEAISWLGEEYGLG
jgi:integrase